jgi:hypothetical protein
MYSWKPYFRELSEKLTEYENRQVELIEILKKSFEDITLEDVEIEGGEKSALTEIDPFSFYSKILSFGVDKRTTILENLRKYFDIENPSPSDFDGVPSAQAQKAWLFSYKFDRQKDDIASLWKLFIEAKDGSISQEIWERALNVKNTGIPKLTQALFWSYPDLYLPIDTNTTPYLLKNQVDVRDIHQGKNKSFVNYMMSITKIKKILNKEFAEISFNAWKNNGKYPPALGLAATDNQVDEWLSLDTKYFWWTKQPSGSPITTDDIDMYNSFYFYLIKHGKIKYRLKIIEISPPDDIQGEPCYPIKWGTHQSPLIEGNKAARICFKIGEITRMNNDVNNLDFGNSEKDWGNPTQDNIQPVRNNILTDEENSIITVTSIVKTFRQIILQGPPGTGKTRLAKLIANLVVDGSVNAGIDDCIKLIQFHPSYSYEDFVRGIVAESNGDKIEYKVEDKILAEMAAQAIKNPNQNYVLIIDEINRANLSSVLGELIYALEYRGKPVESMYALKDGGKRIILPENLYIIGTMNTADRSIGHIDYAIRRRFTFIDVLPNFRLPEISYPEIYKKVMGLFIEDPETYDEKGTGKRSGCLSPEFNFNSVMLGHSYFIADKDKTKLKHQVLPLLKEYISDGILIENDNTSKIIKELEMFANETNS